MIGVIADDLTGSCDVGGKFGESGLKTRVLVTLRELSEVKGCEVVVLNVEARNVDGGEAYARTKRGIEELNDLGAELRYVKIDSTMRGNVGSMIKAVLDELGKPVFITPAFPAQDRVVLNGELYVKGEPLEKTFYAQDLRITRKTSSVPSIISSQLNLEVKHVDLTELRSPIEKLRLKVEDFQVVSFDSVNFNDLSKVVELALRMNAICFGSAGLAEALAKRIPKMEKTFMIVSGSLNEVTLKQIERVTESGLAEPVHLNLKHSPESMALRVNELISGKRSVVIYTKPESLASSPEEFLRYLSDLMRGVELNEVDFLILIGGDTALTILNSLNSRAIDVFGELMPGIPYGRVIGGKINGLTVVTKAGGFNHEDTLVKVVSELKSLRFTS